MKTVTFQGGTYEVPDWAKCIAQDADGDVNVFECFPTLSRIGTWWINQVDTRFELCVPRITVHCERLP